MKKYGNNCDFIHQRNCELMKTFRNLLAESVFIDLPRIFRQTADAPASRFFVSEDRVLNVMRRRRASGSFGVCRGKRLLMYEELERRINSILAADPSFTLYEAIFEAVNSQAPHFYLTPKSVRTILYNIMKHKPTDDEL